MTSDKGRTLGRIWTNKRHPISQFYMQAMGWLYVRSLQKGTWIYEESVVYGFDYKPQKQYQLHIFQSEKNLCIHKSALVNHKADTSVVHKCRPAGISLITAMWSTDYFPNNSEKLHMIILELIDCCSGYLIKITGY